MRWPHTDSSSLPVRRGYTREAISSLDARGANRLLQGRLNWRVRAGCEKQPDTNWRFLEAAVKLWNQLQVDRPNMCPRNTQGKPAMNPSKAGIGLLRNFGVGEALLATPTSPGAASSSPPEVAGIYYQHHQPPLLFAWIIIDRGLLPRSAGWKRAQN